MNHSDEDYVVIRLHRDDAEAYAGDLSRASADAVRDTDDQERQGIASDLNAILALFNGALNPTQEGTA